MTATLKSLHNCFTPTSQTNLLTFTSRLRVRRTESVIEYVIAYPTTLGDPFGFVKTPVDAEINSALTVFVLGLRQSRKTARMIWPDVSVVVASLSVGLVGNESECDN